MKKQNLINLVRYHTEKNDEAFASEVAKIAKEFDARYFGRELPAIQRLS